MLHWKITSKFLVVEGKSKERNAKILVTLWGGTREVRIQAGRTRFIRRPRLTVRLPVRCLVTVMRANGREEEDVLSEVELYPRDRMHCLIDRVAFGVSRS